MTSLNDLLCRHVETQAQTAWYQPSRAAIGYRWLSAVLGMCLSLAGCQHAPPAGPPPPGDPEVEVCTPVYREVTDHEDFTGQTEAVETIDIRPRVTGYLKSVLFRHGAEVKKGDILFEIDPPYYRAEADRAAGVVAEAEARFGRTKLDFERAKKLHSTNVIAKEQFDLAAGDMAQAEATLQSAKASLKIANVNLGYCEVKAPIDGRMSRAFIDPGNLAKEDETVLTRIVSQDPMWVYFDLDERTMLRLRRLAQQGTIGTSDTVKLPVYMGLVDEQVFSRQGVLDFQDNRLDPSTGTLRVRGVFENKDRLLAAGMFVRVRLPIGEPHKSLLIPEQALGTDQGQKFLYVVTPKDEIEYRVVQVGKLHDRQRVVNEGLKADERVVVTGLQRVRPGIKVKPTLIGSPTATAEMRSPSQPK